MKKNYYCLVAGLPDWKPDDKKSPITWQQLRDDLTQELSPADLRLTELFFLPHDHSNLLRQLFATKAAFDACGKYSANEIEQIADQATVQQGGYAGVEGYIQAALEEFFATEQRPSLPQMAEKLQSGWLCLLQASSNTFVRQYADFDNTLRNIFIALQGRKYGFDVEHSVVGDSDVADQLRRSHAHDFGLKGEVDYIEQALQVFATPDLIEREQRIDALRWTFIDEQTFFEYFSVEKAIAAVLKLGMIERWAALDDEQGRQRFAGIIAEIKQSYEKSNNE